MTNDAEKDIDAMNDNATDAAAERPPGARHQPRRRPGDRLQPGRRGVAGGHRRGGGPRIRRPIEIEQDRTGSRTASFMAAVAGAITLVEVMAGWLVPAAVLQPLRTLLWLQDADTGPDGFPDAADLLASAGRVLIVDATRASELCYTLAVGMAASFGRATLVETAPERVEAWRALAERCAPGRVAVLPSVADLPPVAATPGSVMLH